MNLLECLAFPGCACQGLHCCGGHPNPWSPGHADLYSVAKTVMLNVVLAGLHSLVSVQVLVFSAIITPNQDLAFVLAVSYTCICTFLGGYFVHIDSLVSPAAVFHHKACLME